MSRDVEFPGCERQSLSVVPAAVRDDACAADFFQPVLFYEALYGVEGAAHFEGPDALVVLGFEEEVEFRVGGRGAFPGGVEEGGGGLGG